MKKILFAALALASTMPALAQETYENAKIATEDLNGTARYVGMGGAMEALGADISTMSTNPAGIALFRKSTASISFGLNSQQAAPDFNGSSKIRQDSSILRALTAHRSSISVSTITRAVISIISCRHRMD